MQAASIQGFHRSASDYLILTMLYSAKGQVWQLSGIEFDEVRSCRHCTAVIAFQMPNGSNAP